MSSGVSRSGGCSDSFAELARGGPFAVAVEGVHDRDLLAGERT